MACESNTSLQPSSLTTLEGVIRHGIDISSTSNMPTRNACVLIIFAAFCKVSHNPIILLPFVSTFYVATTTNDIGLLFKSHYAAMHRLAMLILRDEDAARDIVHDVFETLFVGGVTDVSSQYLLRAVRNRCLNHIRNLSERERIREIGWTKGDWNVKANIVNMTRWNWRSGLRTMHSQYYSVKEQVYNGSSHALIQVSATYTCGYGKKVRQDNEPSVSGSASSGILK